MAVVFGQRHVVMAADTVRIPGVIREDPEQCLSLQMAFFRAGKAPDAVETRKSRCE